MVNIFSTQIMTLEKLDNIFIELTAKNCNQRCKHCYIDFPVNKNVKDFIPLDKIKKHLDELKENNIQCIYLTGAEPMTHPDFNTILRLCLKKTNVCICTNATFINEKKARFLKKVEEETNNELIFKISIDHFDEIKNDEIRGRGSFRAAINAIKALLKYGFNPIIQISNFFDEEEVLLKTGFKSFFEKINFETTDANFQITSCFNKLKEETFSEEIKNPDCKTGRIITDKGVYSCPFLANDHRGWSGNDFSNFSKKTSLETPFCTICSKTNNPVFTIDYSKFKN